MEMGLIENTNGVVRQYQRHPQSPVDHLCRIVAATGGYQTWIKSYPFKGYQSQLNDILRSAMLSTSNHG